MPYNPSDTVFNSYYKKAKHAMMNVVYSLRILSMHWLTLSRLGYCSQLFGPWGYRKQLSIRWRRRGVRWCAISLLFFKKNILILITFNRWFYWWRYTYRKRIEDSTIYIVECPAKWRRLGWFLCRDLQTISVGMLSQRKNHGWGYYRASWLCSLLARSWRVSTLAYWM